MGNTSQQQVTSQRWDSCDTTFGFPKPQHVSRALSAESWQLAVQGQRVQTPPGLAGPAVRFGLHLVLAAQWPQSEK